MSKKKSNFYTVWNGVVPGVYSDWAECKKQIDGYDGALYKSFPTKLEADRAFKEQPWAYIGKNSDKTARKINYNEHKEIISDSLSVDAACSGNPGDMEYRGVYVRTGEEIFKQGPFPEGTNNIGEFLALVHGLALLKQKKLDIPLYTDSVSAIAWVRNKKCKTKLDVTPANKYIFELIARAEKWLANNTYTTKILKWNTEEWGEIPADFGRK